MLKYFLCLHMQVSRSSNLKIPKQIELFDMANTKNDKSEIRNAIALANDKKINDKETKDELDDKEWMEVLKIPANSNDLIAITVVKKLGVYVFTITEKSPKRFHRVFVSRIQNYCLDTLELFIRSKFFTHGFFRK